MARMTDLGNCQFWAQILALPVTSCVPFGQPGLLSFLTCKMEFMVPILQGLNEIVAVEHLADCLALRTQNVMGIDPLIDFEKELHWGAGLWRPEPAICTPGLCLTRV